MVNVFDIQLDFVLIGIYYLNLNLNSGHFVTHEYKNRHPLVVLARHTQTNTDNSFRHHIMENHPYFLP